MNDDVYVLSSQPGCGTGVKVCCPRLHLVICAMCAFASCYLLTTRFRLANSSSFVNTAYVFCLYLYGTDVGGE